MVDEKQVREVVKNVLAGMDLSALEQPKRKQLGVFDTMEEAIAACNKAYTTFRHYNKEQRENIINEIKKLTHAEAETMAKLAVEDTKMGNVYHKILKHHLVADKTLGTADLETRALAGDRGLTVRNYRSNHSFNQSELYGNLQQYLYACRR